MIIVTLRGGLGNQMFQYAAGKRLAGKHNTTLKIDKSWYAEVQSADAPALREYELDCFALKPVFTKRTDLARIAIPPHSLKRRLIRKLAGSITLYRESETADFFPEVLTAPDNSYLDGYWQSEEYFKDSGLIVRKEFSFITALVGKNLELSQEIQNTNSISLHIRRGDYASHPAFAAMHGMANLDYYHTAVAQITKKIKNPHFFIISDDPDWCKKNLRLQFPATYIGHNQKGFEDMRLMSLCAHNIIANSSFSWWGAWLNANPNKIVIAPKRWFNDPSMSTEKRLPESWIKL
jgi:hypothetical protein